MEAYREYLEKISDVSHREKLEGLLQWALESNQGLESRIAWNQPMITHHGTFILGFSISKNHIAVAPEEVVITRFSDEIKKSGYDHSKQLIKIRWEDEIDYDLLKRIIDFNIMDKADLKTFWR